MKDWTNLIADENLILNTHFTAGRNGSAINKIVLHHNAGNLSIQDCYNTWQTREASAHYQVDVNGRIGQLVNDWDTAWHAGNWDANITSLGIEHADISTSPWQISEQTLDNGAHLTAALCLHYSLGRPQWLVNVFPHSYFTATACPAPLAGDQNNAYMTRAGQWYDAMVSTGNTASITPSSAPASAPGENLAPLGDVHVSYSLHQIGGGWLEEIRDYNNSDANGFAGLPNHSHDYLIIEVDQGSMKYRVHSIDGQWHDWISKADRNDLVNGAAGINGVAIDGVQMYYITPTGRTLNQAWYRSQTTKRAGWLDVVCDDGTSINGYTDTYAGILGEPLDRLQISITDSNPF